MLCLVMGHVLVAHSPPIVCRSGSEQAMFTSRNLDMYNDKITTTDPNLWMS